MNDEINNIIETVVKTVCNETSGSVTLALAKKLAAKIEEKALEIGVRAVVAVCNQGARPVLVECTDGSYIASYDIAVNKAYTSVALKTTTKQLKKIAAPGESLYGIQFTNNNRIVIFGGGVPLKKNGVVIGGLGVSGGTEEQDTYLADFGTEIFEKLINENRSI